MSAFEIAKLLHIVAATVWVGGAVFTVILGFRMTTAEPAHRVGFARDMLFLGRRVFAPSVVVALGAGIWMVIDVDPIYTFEQAWIVIGLGALVASAGISTGYMLPRSRRALGMIESGDGPGAAATMRTVALASRINAGVLLVAVWAMVFKPGY